MLSKTICGAYFHQAARVKGIGEFQHLRTAGESCHLLVSRFRLLVLIAPLEQYLCIFTLLRHCMVSVTFPTTLFIMR